MNKASAVMDNIIDVEENIIEEKELVDIESKEQNNKKINILYRFVKRIIDIVCGLVGVIFLMPVSIIVYAIKVICKENDGPLFYTQLRYGKNGRMFKLYKFRSMCMHADKKLKEHLANNPDAKKEFEETQKLQNDPRVTKIGNFLRKSSIDELPQMINILKGDMSLIGPRPVIDGEIERYGKNRDKFLSVRPGLTGYWQANGRSNTTYEERMQMELYYVDNMSLSLDVKIFFKTFITVIKKEGAV